MGQSSHISFNSFVKNEYSEDIELINFINTFGFYIDYNYNELVLNLDYICHWLDDEKHKNDIYNFLYNNSEFIYSIDYITLTGQSYKIVLLSINCIKKLCKKYNNEMTSMFLYNFNKMEDLYSKFLIIKKGIVNANNLSKIDYTDNDTILYISFIDDGTINTYISMEDNFDSNTFIIVKTINNKHVKHIYNSLLIFIYPYLTKDGYYSIRYNIIINIIHILTVMCYSNNTIDYHNLCISISEYLKNIIYL